MHTADKHSFPFRELSADQPNYDPHPLMDVVERLTKLPQDRIDWKKLVPHRWHCLHKTLRGNVIILVPTVLSATAISVCCLCLTHHESAAPWFGSGLLLLAGLLGVLAALLHYLRKDYQEFVVLFFAIEQRWGENGYATRFLMERINEQQRRGTHILNQRRNESSRNIREAPVDLWQMQSHFPIRLGQSAHEVSNGAIDRGHHALVRDRIFSSLDYLDRLEERMR